MGLFTRKSVDELTAEAHTDNLRRTLGPFSLTTLGIGAIIGRYSERFIRHFERRT